MIGEIRSVEKIGKRRVGLYIILERPREPKRPTIISQEDPETYLLWDEMERVLQGDEELTKELLRKFHIKSFDMNKLKAYKAYLDEVKEVEREIEHIERLHLGKVELTQYASARFNECIKKED